MQRSNLSSYQEGVAFLLCQKLFGFSDEEMAIRLHKSRQTIASKRELAIAANYYAKYADSSVVNAFLRHFSNGHKDIMNKLVDTQMIKHSVKMIARGGTVRHLQRFVEIFANENNYQRTADHQQHAVLAHQESKSIDAVLSIFEKLKTELPKKYVGRINRLEDNYLKADLNGFYVSSNTNISEDHNFRCPTCTETFEIDRKIVPEEDKVLFIINPKNSSTDARKAVFSFPVYKEKVNSIRS